MELSSENKWQFEAIKYCRKESSIVDARLYT